MIPDDLFIFLTAIICTAIGFGLAALYYRFHVLPNRYIRRRERRLHYSHQPIEPGKL